jgi:hypothetical protein
MVVPDILNGEIETLADIDKINPSLKEGFFNNIIFLINYLLFFS